MASTSIKRKCECNHYNSNESSSSLKSHSESLIASNYFMNHQDNEDITTCKQSSTVDKMSELTENQSAKRMKPSTDLVVDHRASVDLNIEEMSKTDDGTLDSETLVVIKNERVDNTKLGIVSKSRTSGIFNLNVGSTDRVVCSSFEDKIKGNTELDSDTRNRAVSSSVAIEAIYLKEVVEIKTVKDERESVPSVVSFQATPIDSNNKKKKHRSRHKSSNKSFSVYEKKDLTTAESSLNGDRPVVNSESVEEKEYLKIDVPKRETGGSEIEDLPEVSKNSLDHEKTKILEGICNGECTTTFKEIANVSTITVGLSRVWYKVKKKNEEEDFSIQGFVGRFAVEVTEMIFDLLNPKDLASSSLVCKSWRDAINSNIIWRKHCKQRGWTSTLKDWSCFQKSSHLWSGVSYTNYDDDSKLSPLCIQRVYFNKYAHLIKNWKERKFSTYRIAKPNRLINFPTSGKPLVLPCDGKYVVMFEKVTKQLLVWSLEGKPHKVDCDSCQQIDISEIRVGFDTIAIVQEPYISVYINKGIRFELAYIKSDFAQLKNNQDPNGRTVTRKIILEMNSNYLFACSYCKNSPAYVWDRFSGNNVVTVTFDLNYPILSAVNMCGSSVYFGRQSDENSHKVIEFNLKQKCWANFNVNCLQKVKQLVISDDYICTVTSEYIRREFANEVFIWNRTTGAIIKSVKGSGRSYQFVNNYLVYYYNSRVIVHSLEGNDVFREIYLTECITNIKLVFNHLVVLTTADKVEVWDWMLRRKLYTAFYSFSAEIDIFVDCEKIVLLADSLREIIMLRF